MPSFFDSKSPVVQGILSNLLNRNIKSIHPDGRVDYHDDTGLLTNMISQLISRYGQGAVEAAGKATAAPYEAPGMPGVALILGALAQAFAPQNTWQHKVGQLAATGAQNALKVETMANALPAGSKTRQAIENAGVGAYVMDPQAITYMARQEQLARTEPLESAFILSQIKRNLATKPGKADNWQMVFLNNPPNEQGLPSENVDPERQYAYLFNPATKEYAPGLGSKVVKQTGGGTPASLVVTPKKALEYVAVEVLPEVRDKIVSEVGLEKFRELQDALNDPLKAGAAASTVLSYLEGERRSEAGKLVGEYIKAGDVRKAGELLSRRLEEQGKKYGGALEFYPQFVSEEQATAFADENPSRRYIIGDWVYKGGEKERQLKKDELLKILPDVKSEDEMPEQGMFIYNGEIFVANNGKITKWSGK